MNLLTPDEQWQIVNDLLRDQDGIGVAWQDLRTAVCWAVLARLSNDLLAEVLHNHLVLDIRDNEVRFILNPNSKDQI